MGRGGQGIVFVGEVLAEALFEQGMYVAQLQSYGAEVRGGSVLSYVVFDKDVIENPFVESFDVAIVLHEAGLKRWMKHLERSSIVVVDDLVGVSIPKARKLPIARTCSEKGLIGRENMVALGIVLASRVIDLEVAKSVLKKRKGFNENMKALELGLELGKEISEELSRALAL